MKRVKIHLLLSFSFGVIMLAATQVSAETFGEYCRRTTLPEDGDAAVQRCIQDHGGNANALYNSLPEQGDLPLNQNGNSGSRGISGGISGGGNRDSSGGASSVPSAESPSYFDHSVTVSGDAFYQPLTGAGIGHADIIAQSVISATNVWGTVPPGVRVCFVGHSGGGVIFKDSSITPHPLSWLDHYVLGTDTCVDLPGAGTVVLVEAANPASAASPQSICQIKLTDTLFLRAAPAGEIIALVWLNSEVPVFAVVEHWYRVEFEGQVGYISRYHRQVLAGAC